MCHFVNFLTEASLTTGNTVRGWFPNGTKIRWVQMETGEAWSKREVGSVSVHLQGRSGGLQQGQTLPGSKPGKKTTFVLYFLPSNWLLFVLDTLFVPVQPCSMGRCQTRFCCVAYFPGSSSCANSTSIHCPVALPLPENLLLTVDALYKERLDSKYNESQKLHLKNL